MSFEDTLLPGATDPAGLDISCIGLIHALPSADRRVFSREEAASYVGVSPGYFDRLVKRGSMPQPLPMPGVKRWDKKALDHALNEMSGLSNGPEAEPVSAYDAWRSSRGQS